MITDFKKLPDNVSKQWAIEELKDFLGWINHVEVDTERCYSKSYTYIYDCWNYYLHEKLKEYGFVNGKPEENTFEKRPKAAFWWIIYCTSVHNYRPFYDHHCSSKEVKEQMINIVTDAIEYIKGE